MVILQKRLGCKLVWIKGATMLFRSALRATSIFFSRDVLTISLTPIFLPLKNKVFREFLSLSNIEVEKQILFIPHNENEIEGNTTRPLQLGSSSTSGSSGASYEMKTRRTFWILKTEQQSFVVADLSKIFEVLKTEMKNLPIISQIIEEI